MTPQSSRRSIRTVSLSALYPALLVFTLASAGPSLGQGFGVPEELLNNTRPVQGDAIQICIDPLSVGAEFDRAVSQAIADALFLTPTFHDAPSGFPLDGLGYLDELQIAMTNTCNMLAGISLQPNSPFPAWATTTRSYAQVPFVLVAADPAYQTLSDIPRDKFIGTALGSLGESQFLAFVAQQPRDQQWRRLPYADPELMVRRLLDGKLAGILIWQPALARVTGGDPGAQGMRIIPTDPLPPVEVSVGALVSNRDAFLRSQIDEAIGALVADGTIAAIMEEHGVAGTPGPS